MFIISVYKVKIKISTRKSRAKSVVGIGLLAGAFYNMPEEESIVSKEKYDYDSYYWDETSDENRGQFPARDVVIRYSYKKKTPEVF